MRPWLIATAMIVLGGCQSPPAANNQTYLTEPYFQYVTIGPLCLQLYAVDGNNQGWQDVECGTTTTGFLQTRVLLPAEVTQIQTAFAALPAQSDPTCANDITTNGTQALLRHTTTTTDVTWMGCITGDQLAQPYATAASTLMEFVQVPLLQNP